MSLLSQLTEKELFFLSVIPPVVFTFMIIRAMHARPDLLLEAALPLISGVKGISSGRSGYICLQFEPGGRIEAELASLHKRSAKGLKLLRAGSADAVGSALHSLRKMAKTPWIAPDTPKANGVIDSAMTMGSCESQVHHEADFGSSQTGLAVPQREVWVNLKHLTRASVIPVLSLAFYAWDGMVLHRRASYDFPMLHCMQPDCSHCFYIEQEYSLWRYPPYHRLDCEGMRNKTVLEPSGFFFKEPPKARFYKCYVSVFHFGSVVGIVGDVLALTALVGFIIARASSLAIHVKDDWQPEHVRSRLKKAQCILCVLTILLSASVFSVSCLYGRWTNDFIIYAFLPGLFLFAIFLVTNRIDLLQERLRGLEADSDSESGGFLSELSDDEGWCESASRRLYGGHAKRHTQKVRVPTFESESAMVLPIARQRRSSEDLVTQSTALSALSPVGVSSMSSPSRTTGGTCTTSGSCPPFSPDAKTVARTLSPQPSRHLQSPVSPVVPMAFMSASQMAFAAVQERGASPYSHRSSPANGSLTPHPAGVPPAVVAHFRQR